VFWPRLEISPSFVLSKLRRILFVSQNRLEMGENGDECLPEVGQNRLGFGVKFGRKGHVGRMVFGRRSSSAQHQHRRACRFLSEPKYAPDARYHSSKHKSRGKSRENLSALYTTRVVARPNLEMRWSKCSRRKIQEPKPKPALLSATSWPLPQARLTVDLGGPGSFCTNRSKDSAPQRVSIVL
jgi:hypothetical protein